MKVIVMSDSHGKNSAIDKVLEKHSDADLFIHCGDIETDEHVYPNISIVAGNNDIYYDYPDMLKLKVGNHRLLVMHGNQSYFQNRLQFLSKKAIEEHCDIVCYGHTHVAAIDDCNGIKCINPGSLWHSRDGRSPSYVILTLDDKINVELVFIK